MEDNDGDNEDDMSFESVALEGDVQIDNRRSTPTQRSKDKRMKEVIKMVGDLKDDGYRHIGTVVRDVGSRASNCELCGTAIRYEHYIVFSEDTTRDVRDVSLSNPDDDTWVIIVGSTCVHHFEDYIQMFDTDKVMKKYKTYRDLYMEVHDVEESEVPDVSVEEVGSALDEIRTKRQKKLVRDNGYGAELDFLEDNKDDNEFYDSLYTQLVGKRSLSNKQLDALHDSMNGDYDSTSGGGGILMCKAYVLRSIIEFADDDVIELWSSGDKDDRGFLKSLYNSYVERRSWSPNQETWVDKKINRYKDNLGKIVQYNKGNSKCSECDSEEAVQFKSRGFRICPKGHVTLLPDSVNDEGLEKVE